MPTSDEVAAARELIGWARDVEQRARATTSAAARLESDAMAAIGGVVTETVSRDAAVGTGGGASTPASPAQASPAQASPTQPASLAPRVDLTTVAPATKNLVAALRRRERWHTTYGSRLELAGQVASDLGALVEEARPAGSRWRLALRGQQAKQRATAACDRLRAYRSWAETYRIADQFAAAVRDAGSGPSDGLSAPDADFWTDILRRPDWYAAQVGAEIGAGAATPFAPADEVRRAAELGRALGSVSARAQRAEQAARAAVAPVRSSMLRAALGAMPTARVREVTTAALRLGPLETGGYPTIQHILDAREDELVQLNGVGEQTARQVKDAAAQLANALADELPFRIDVERRDAPSTVLVQALYGWDRLADVSRVLGRTEFARLTDELRPLSAASPPRQGISVFLPPAGSALVDTIRDSLDLVSARNAWHPIERAGELISREALSGQVSLGQGVDPSTAWADFVARSAEYYALLGRIADLKADEHSETHGLPDEIVARVRAQPLDDELCRVTLRGYQAFGTRFSLVQRHVIIGDEMGLGKTIQAIAALAHLKSTGAIGRLLVICPASVLVNWSREIAERSALRVHLLHGADRDSALDEWLRAGDVAVTTFATLGALDLAEIGFTMIVVDEAHLLKNPRTQRSQHVRALLGRTSHTLFLTGTPMENRLDEFQTLVGYLQPSLVPTLDNGYLSPERFREQVAPAYLRRNQQDVLGELPALVITDDWQEFSHADRAAYHDAVVAGNFMAMRRAAFARPEQSAKLARLTEIVAEAGDNGRKTIVFSYFRDVLDAVAAALPTALGPLTGDVAPIRRQDLVDRFTAAEDGAVLLSQIQAGGVGLNMQAGSVVVLCEPQVKPTLEAQAIARAHRMGQVRGVRVHRLLTPEGVDQRMVEILAGKQHLFEAYVRHSEIADADSHVPDEPEAGLAQTIVAEEQQRIGPV